MLTMWLSNKGAGIVAGYDRFEGAAMPFVYKDLMVTVLSDQLRCWPGSGCPHASHCDCSVISCPLPTVHRPEMLTQMKNELKVALAQVEAAEAAARSLAKPQSLAEAEFLEKQMVEALEELRKLKEDLRGTPTEEK